MGRRTARLGLGALGALLLTLAVGVAPALACGGPVRHGFGLSVDAPEVLDFYARRSPVFMAASFDATAVKARGQRLGDGTPVHLTIPSDRLWVPLRILGLGLRPEDGIQADVYLL